jgi:hypothetical protein
MTSARVHTRPRMAKGLLLLSVFLLCSIALAQGRYRLGQVPKNQNPNDYPIKLHISTIHYRPCTAAGTNTYCEGGFYVDAILNGKKVELFGGVDKHQLHLIVPGDYEAMLPKKPISGGREVLFQSYYMLLPDKSAWVCEITGLSE